MKSNLLQCNEQFGYDALNRLNSIKLNSAAPQTISYAANGNITSKYDVGTYSYNNNNHAVSGVQSFGYTPPGSDVALLSSITHTSYNRVSEIVKNNNTLTYSYGSDKLRNKSIYMSGATDVDVKYYVGSYEKAINSGGNPVATLKEHDYIYSPESLAAIVTKSMIGTYSLNYVHTDHLGSPRVITNSGKTIISRYRYDAWGTRTLVSGTNITTRGFTGHEHLDDYFGLINMNARLYDPALGRFISLDPYVQIPDFTQSFNRYSYVLNNPLVYTDPSGEFFIIDSWLIGLFSGGWDEANRRAANDAKIWAGLFVSDPNRNFGQRLWETVSRVTWQLPQTVAGFLTSHTHNTFGLRGGVESVDYMNGATVLRTNTSWGGVTLGSYIIGDNSIRADPNNRLFQHEYGHYIQSQEVGWGYLVSHGIPSLRSAAKDDPNYDHSNFWTEQDANKKAYEYFYSKMGSDLKWDSYFNPINDTEWINRIHDKYSRYSPIPNYSPVRVPSLSYNGSFYGEYIWQGINNDYLYSKYRKQSSVKSLIELLSLYKR